MIFIRPTVEPYGRMKDVLHTVDDRRPVWTFDKLDQSLEAEQVRAAMFGEDFQE